MKTERYEEIFPDGHRHIIQEVGDTQLFDNTLNSLSRKGIIL